MLIAAMTVGGALLATAWVTSDAAREAGADLALALTRAGIAQKVAAPAMGLTPPQLTEQLAARQPMNHFRVVNLFEAFPSVELAYYDIRAERRGLCFIARPELTEIVRVAALFKRSMRKRLGISQDALRDEASA